MRKKLFGFILLFIGLTVLHFTVRLGWQFSPVILRIRAFIFIEELIIALILSLGGYILQNLLINPLAEPYVLGVASGASFGAVIAIFLSLTPIILFRTVFAMGGALGVSALIFMLSKRQSGFSIGIAVLAGVGFNALFSGLIMLTQSVLAPNDLQASISWIMGNIDMVSVPEIMILLAGMGVLIVFYFANKKEMDIYRSGDEMSRAVGVDTGRLKMTGFIAVSIGTAAAVSVSGMIGFIGLIVPHITRMIFKAGAAKSFFPLFLTGSCLILSAGIISRSVMPGAILPIGVLTSLIGAPFFIFILVKNYRGV